MTHYSLQGDHAHLIVEAKGTRALACGMKSIAESKPGPRLFIPPCPTRSRA